MDFDKSKLEWNLVHEVKIMLSMSLAYRCGRFWITWIIITSNNDP